MHLGVQCIVLLLGASACLALPSGKSHGQYVGGYTTHVVGVQQPLAIQTHQVAATVPVAAPVPVHAAPVQLTAQTHVAAPTHYVAQPTYVQAPATYVSAAQPASYVSAAQPASYVAAAQPALYSAQKVQVDQTQVQVAKQPEVELEKEFHYVAPAQISVRRHKVHVHQPTVHVSQPEIHVSRPEYHVVAPTKYHVEPERPKAQLQDTEYHVVAEPDVEVVKQKVNVYKPDVRVHQKEVKLHHPEVDVVAPTQYEEGPQRVRAQRPLEEYHVHAEPDVEVVQQKVNVYRPDVRVHQKQVKVHRPEVDVVAPTQYEVGPQRVRAQRPLEEYHVHAEPDVEVVKQKVNVYKPEVRVHQKEVKVHHSEVDVVAPTQYDFGPQRVRAQRPLEEYHVVAEPDVEVVKQKVNVYKPEVRVHQQEVKVHSPEYHVVKEPTVEVAQDNARYYQSDVGFSDHVFDDATYVQAPAAGYVAQTQAVAGTVFGGKSHGTSAALTAQVPVVDTYATGHVKTAYVAGPGQPVSFGQTQVQSGIGGFSGYHTKSSH